MNANDIAKFTDAELIQCVDREDWLRKRRESIGGSESPTLFGVGYGSPVSMYANKVGPEEFSESTRRQRIGLGLEGHVCDLYQEEWGGRVEKWPSHLIARHKEHKHMHATCDAILWDDDHKGPGSLSIKTWSEFGRKDWENEPPLAHQIQLNQELAVLGLDWGYIAVVFGAVDIERFYVERNDHFIESLYQACGEFWRLVTERIEPPIDESRATAEALFRLHPDDSGLAVRLPAEAAQVLSDRGTAKETIKAAEKVVARCDNQLKSWLGDHTYGQTDDGETVSWKTSDVKEFTVAARKQRTLRNVKALPKGVIAVEREALENAIDLIEEELDFEELEPKSFEVADVASGVVIVDFKGSGRNKIPKWLKERLLQEDPHCHWCGATLTLASATYEHKVPLSVGGTNEQKNITIACEKCNQERGDDARLPVNLPLMKSEVQNV